MTRSATSARSSCGGVGLPAAMSGAAVLAAGVALTEIPCTAGFPVIWSDLVAGTVMISIGVTIVAAADVMNTVGGVLVVVGAAVAASVVIASLDRWMRGPRPPVDQARATTTRSMASR